MVDVIIINLGPGKSRRTSKRISHRMFKSWDPKHYKTKLSVLLTSVMEKMTLKNFSSMAGKGWLEREVLTGIVYASGYNNSELVETSREGFWDDGWKNLRAQTICRYFPLRSWWVFWKVSVIIKPFKWGVGR